MTEFDRAMQVALEHYRANRIQSAEGILRQIDRAYPNQPGVLHLLGLVAIASRRLPEAIALLQNSARLGPKPDTYINLATVFSHSDRWVEAADACRKAIELNPSSAVAHEKLGTALWQQGDLSGAQREFHASLRAQPMAVTYMNLGVTLLDSGRPTEALDEHRKAAQLDPTVPGLDTNLLLTRLFEPHTTPQTVMAESAAWGRRQSIDVEPPRVLDADPSRPLRVGYVSPDFRSHPVATFFESLLMHHDPKQVVAVCYSDAPRPDEITVRFSRLAKQWRMITGLTTEAAYDRIKKDRIDILVDLSGHTAGNRLQVFAKRAAPIQASYLGYPATTGLPTIDYRITDSFADPPGMTEQLYTERLVRLPRTFLCYRPPDDVIAAPKREPQNGITFGSFNARRKINEPLVEIWSKILQRVPGSKLLLKNASLKDSAVRDSLLQQFIACGIGPERLLLHQWASSAQEHLQLYNNVDIALDTYPYDGTTTTCEALWMGVPVVTLAGDSHAARVGVSILSNVGLPELVAGTPDQYIEIATNLAADTNRLAQLGTTLRQRMRQSPLMDGPQFAHDMEAAYRQMWRDRLGIGG